MPHAPSAAQDTHHDAQHDSGKSRPPHASRTAGNTAGNTLAHTRECAASRVVPDGLRPHNAPARWLGVLLGPLVLAAGLAATLGTLLTGCGDKTPPGEVVTMRACRICHGADRICANIGKLDRAGWEKTVDRMIAGGANVTPEERTAVIDWLSTRKPGEKPLCP